MTEVVVMGMVRGPAIGVAMRSVTGRVTGVGMGVVMGMIDMGIGAVETTGPAEMVKLLQYSSFYTWV